MADSNSVIYSRPESDGQGLDQSFHDWFKAGKTAFDRDEFGESVVCFKEALKRCRGMHSVANKELEARRLQALALEKLEKYAEAVDEYMFLEEICELPEDKTNYEQKVRLLKKLAIDGPPAKQGIHQLVVVLSDEIKFAPLYCSVCERWVPESQVYNFRRGQTNVVNCMCGSESVPLTRRDHLYETAKRQVAKNTARRKGILKAAENKIADGKQKSKAILLAVFGGLVGAHKFYLGEKGAGWVYIIWCWTLIPWLIALYEALEYSQMSRVTFNLTYNLDKVLALVPAEVLDDSPLQDSRRMKVFSMEIPSDPEDLDNGLSPSAQPDG